MIDGTKDNSDRGNVERSTAGGCASPVDPPRSSPRGGAPSVSVTGGDHRAGGVLRFADPNHDRQYPHAGGQIVVVDGNYRLTGLGHISWASPRSGRRRARPGWPGTHDIGRPEAPSGRHVACVAAASTGVSHAGGDGIDRAQDRIEPDPVTALAITRERRDLDVVERVQIRPAPIE